MTSKMVKIRMKMKINAERVHTLGRTFNPSLVQTLAGSALTLVFPAKRATTKLLVDTAKVSTKFVRRSGCSLGRMMWWNVMNGAVFRLWVVLQ